MGFRLYQMRSTLTKKDQNGPQGVKKFCKWIDVKVLNWVENWLQHDEKCRKGG